MDRANPMPDPIAEPANMTRYQRDRYEIASLFESALTTGFNQLDIKWTAKGAQRNTLLDIEGRDKAECDKMAAAVKRTAELMLSDPVVMAGTSQTVRDAAIRCVEEMDLRDPDEVTVGDAE